MATYTYRKYCETCGEYKYTTDTVEWTTDTWVPDGCEGHELSEIVIEEIE
jgi:hypothetical protein